MARADVARRLGPFDGRIDADLVRRCAAATGEADPEGRAGTTVPATAFATRIWEAQEAARAALVPEAIQRAASGGVHGEHDVVVHRPVVPGEPLRTWVERHGTRPAGRHSLVTLRYTTVDADDAVVAEQWWTTVYLGTTCEIVGEPAPDHSFPEGARRRPLGSHAVPVDAGMARRYAEVSGDWSAHHFDVEAARASGADRPFLHGLCTMAMCAQAIMSVGGATERLRRLAVRFASPMPLGETLDVHLYDAGPLGIAFEAACGDTPVITHGRADPA